MTRISESELVLPALYVISRQPGITTTGVIHELREMFHPIGEDAEILQGRSDDKFSQIVRNLVSHHTLDRHLGYTKLGVGAALRSTHMPTAEGLAYLKQNLASLASLLSNKLGYEGMINGIEEIDKANAVGNQITVFDENFLTTEGVGREVTSQVYTRSVLLRDKAIEQNTHNGRIVCKACGFDFLAQYGELGRGFIEVHHLRPIYQYEGSDLTKVLGEALKDLVPLCSNCHRMVHRKREQPLTVDELRELLKK